MITTLIAVAVHTLAPLGKDAVTTEIVLDVSLLTTFAPPPTIVVPAGHVAVEEPAVPTVALAAIVVAEPVAVVTVFAPRTPPALTPELLAITVPDAALTA